MTCVQSVCYILHAIEISLNQKPLIDLPQLTTKVQTLRLRQKMTRSGHIRVQWSGDYYRFSKRGRWVDINTVLTRGDKKWTFMIITVTTYRRHNIRQTNNYVTPESICHTTIVEVWSSLAFLKHLRVVQSLFFTLKVVWKVVEWALTPFVLFFQLYHCESSYISLRWYKMMPTLY